MAFLQSKLSLKVAQRQILTPGLMQMVSVLALNKLELKEMINAEIVENPVLEEVEEHVPLLEDLAGREAERERPTEEKTGEISPEERDPFEEIDFGSYFQDYLDPGYRTGSNFEMSDKPSFENFLSVPETLTDHLQWQLGSLIVTPELREAAEYIIGNLNEDGYLATTLEDLEAGFAVETSHEIAELPAATGAQANGRIVDQPADKNYPDVEAETPLAVEHASGEINHFRQDTALSSAALLLNEALILVRRLDPVGVAAGSLRECLLLQLAAQRREFELIFASPSIESGAKIPPSAEETQAEPSSTEEIFEPGLVPDTDPQLIRKKLLSFEAAQLIVTEHLALLQKKDMRELGKLIGRSSEEVQEAVELIRSLDPKPGQRYNRPNTRLIEPDVAFVKRGDDIVIVMNEDDMPTLRLNSGYKKLLTQTGTEKDVKDYVKERYRSALQLMRNIEQRKSTILRTCEAIIRRQPEFLEHGVNALRPMMIKDVAEEIGVHPSTVSRAVSNKYVHTAQGVFELRFFFSEGVNGPEGAATPLLLLKRKVKKLIEDENPQKPLTDDQLAVILQGQGIRVTRRTVAKYREDLKIPSTHQRRVRA